MRFLMFFLLVPVIQMEPKEKMGSILVEKRFEVAANRTVPHRLTE